MEQKRHPYQVHEIKVRPEQFKRAFTDSAAEQVKRITDALNETLEVCRPIIEQPYVHIKDKPFWYVREVHGLYMDFRQVKPPMVDGLIRNNSSDAQLHDNYSKDIQDYQFRLATPNELIAFLNCKLNASTKFYEFITLDYLSNDSWYRYYNGGPHYECNTGAYPLLLIHHLDITRKTIPTAVKVLHDWLKEKLIPQGLTTAQERNYVKLMQALQPLDVYFDWDDNGDRVTFDNETLKQDIQSGKFHETVFEFSFDLEETLDEIKQGNRQYVVSPAQYKQQLLAYDSIRANIDEYPAEQIEDINKGHWELCEEVDDEDAITLSLPDDEIWTARPPQCDIISNAICAIDFGTKSTVVVRRADGERLLRIGADSLKNKVELRDYENPTVIYFHDLEAFCEAYAARAGRPFTKWEQVFVSHTAENKWQENGKKQSGTYDVVLHALKQWANARGDKLPIQDEQRKETQYIPPYLELEEDDFDPIECYAYYLGLYINNMRNGICMDYILSFPVNYEKEVREHLLQSFERGLKKSLPPALLTDEEAMQDFRVYAGASEPAAYAMAALKEFGLEPQNEGELTAYGVFDFGGGTTDFDFGIERVSENRRKYKFILEQFGKGGDVHLGGENILNVLAYEVFKANFDTMREKQIPIVLPLGCKPIAGGEGLVMGHNPSDTALMNQKLLAEKLRPLWERQQESSEQDYQAMYSQGLNISLFSTDKKSEVIPLNIHVELLEAIIRQLIDAGITNFFAAWRTAFANRAEQVLPMHIFLAGNSCRSPIVQELFMQHIQEIGQEIATEAQKTDGNVFVLHMPLGMKDTEEDSEEREAVSLDQVRTGKTGVAFGLLRSRKGGKDVHIINSDLDATGEAIFPYFLGDIDEEEHFHVRIGLGVGYGHWEPFTYADEEDFEIYFTNKPAAVKNTLSETDVQNIRCRIQAEEVADDDDIQIFLRKVTPNAIEYAVGCAEDFANFDANTFTGKIYRRELHR